MHDKDVVSVSFNSIEKKGNAEEKFTGCSFLILYDLTLKPFETANSSDSNDCACVNDTWNKRKECEVKMKIE